MTPLHIACDKGNKEIVLFLMTNGFDFTIKNGAGQKFQKYLYIYTQSWRGNNGDEDVYKQPSE